MLGQLTTIERERLLRLAHSSNLKKKTAHLPPIVPVTRNGRIPLSFAQQRLWFLTRMEDVGDAYHNPFGLQLQGNLDVAALRQALNRIVARHEALRTTFVLADGEPVQRVSPADASKFHLTEYDVSRRREPQAELERLAGEEAAAAFDLETGPLIRGRLVRLSEKDHALVINIHHIVWDGWSTGIFFNELTTLYSAYHRGERDPLPELVVQYADYAVQERQWMEGEVLRAQVAYWKECLSDAPALLELPTETKRPHQQDYRGGFEEWMLDRALTARLKRLSSENDGTLYVTVLAAWAALLARLSGQSEVVIGTPVANRERPEIEDLIGFFVNTLPIRLDLSGSPTVQELLKRVKKTVIAAQQNQNLPFDRVVEAIQPERSLSYSPVFQVMLAWQNVPEGTLLLPELEIRPLEYPFHRPTHFDLTLALQESEGRIVGGFEYASALYSAETIRRCGKYLRALLERIVVNEAVVVERLPLLDDEERRQLLYEWNHTGSELTTGLQVHELFERQAEEFPDAVAVEYEGTFLTYGELNRRSNQLGRHLRKLGIQPEVRVAICVERGLAMIIGILGVLKAGGAYVPLDPRYPAERLRFMLADSGSRIVVTEGCLRNLVSAISSGLPIVDVQDVREWSGETDNNLTPFSLFSWHLAYIIYTSGSAGAPKGVMVPHDGLCNRIAALCARYNLSTQDRFLQFASINFDQSVEEIFCVLLSGATSLLRTDSWLAGAQDFWALCAKESVTILDLPTRFWQQMLGDGSVRIPASVRLVIIGGEAADNRALSAWFRHGSERPTLLNTYGPTEGIVVATVHSMTADASLWQSIGKPIANTRIYILDRQGQPVPPGVTGELCIGGPGLARGYLNRPELTAERFLAEPFAATPHGRMYRTGDLAKWRADGNICFIGRNDSQVKLRGFRIELSEIELRLEEHGDVREAVVTLHEDVDGERRLVAYYTTANESQHGVGGDELRSYVAKTMPDYMVPAAFVRMGHIPLTRTGKLDRKALPALDRNAYGVSQYEAPCGQLEEMVAGIWAEVLHLERVGRHENFFKLGGHSLLAVRMIERMRQCGLQVDVKALFATPTVAELVAKTKRSGNDRQIQASPNRIPMGCKAIAPAMLSLVELSDEEIKKIVAAVPDGAPNVQDIYPLAPFQEGILFHHLMGESGDPYLTAVLMGFDTRVRLEKYVDALQKVIVRHDILRTAVAWEGLREPVQVVWRKAELRVEEVALEDRPDAALALYRRYDPRSHRIDVRQAPMLRAYMAQDSERERWLLLLLLHHLVADHTTLEVMQQEIEAHLNEQADLPSALPFRNLVAQARLGISPKEHEAFFRQMLGTIEEPTLPFGLLDVQGDGSGIAEAHLQLEPQLARRARSRARNLGVSAASLWHLAWALVLYRVCGHADVVFGTVLFGRMHGGEGSDRVMGPFMNTLPIFIRIGEEGVEDAVRRTQSLLAELLQHEHASLAMAQRCSAVPSPLPLFSALLNYRHTSGAAQMAFAESRRGFELLYGEERTNYPFTLAVDDIGEGFALTAQAPEAVGPYRVCEFMREAMDSMLVALENFPATPVRNLNVLVSAELRRVLYEWNSTRADFPMERCVHELFDEQAERTPDATALVYEDQQMTYGEMARRSNQLAHYLRRLGVRVESRVGICMERSLEMIVALLGVLKAGGAYVPMDPLYPVERLRFMAEDAQLTVLVTEKAAKGKLEGLVRSEVDLDEKRKEIRKERGEEKVQYEVLPQNAAYMIYTSGSTGKPKGVQISHRALMNLLCSMMAVPGITSHDVVLATTSISFDIAGLEMYLPLMTGARVKILGRTAAADGWQFVEEVKRGVTMMQATPAMWQMMLEAGWTGDARLRALCGGEALTVGLKNELVSRCERGWNVYGPTETTIWSVMEELEAGTDRVRIGKPISNTQTYVLNDAMDPVPVGVAGELFIGGEGLARGYWKQGALTAERFVPNEFSGPGQRLYRTGDRARWLEDGRLEFLGRNDFQLKIRGYRIELEEIESSLREHAQIQAAAVVAREDKAGDKRLVAYYTGEAPIETEDLLFWMSRKLPEYMVPAAYVHLPSLPLTSNGKLDRKALPAPGMDAYASPGYVAPEGEVELAVADVWSKVLQVEGIGRHDNFFQLGGHSLLATRIVSLLQELLQVRMPLRVLFENPTLASTARAIENIAAAHGIDVAAIARIVNEISSLTEHETTAKLAAMKGKEK